MIFGESLKVRQFFILLWKCYLIRKRHYIWTFFEIMLPIFIASAALIANSGGKSGTTVEDPIRYKPVAVGKNLRSYYTLLYTPVNEFTMNLMSRLTESVDCRGVESADDLNNIIMSEIPFTISDSVEKLLLGLQENETIAGVIFDMSDVGRHHLAVGNDTVMPLKLNYTLRVRDFELQSEAFPKKQDFGPFPNADHYIRKNFVAVQVLINYAYLQMLGEQLYPEGKAPAIPEIREIRARRFPFPKYIKHPRFQVSIISRFFPGTGKLNTLQLTIEYCTVLGFVVMIVLLIKSIVDEKVNRAREMLRLMGMSDWIYYFSQFANTFTIMAVQSLLLTAMFCMTPNAQLKGANPSLVYTVMLCYSASAILYGMMLSVFFKKPTNAMIIGFIVWLGVQEIAGMLFEKRAGLTETSGLIKTPEWFHLVLCLIPNYALKVVNELLVECEVYAAYGTFVQQYRVYSADWPNLRNVLPLYQYLSILSVMAAMLTSCLIYGFIIWYFDVFRVYNQHSNVRCKTLDGVDNEAFTGGDQKGKQQDPNRYFESDPQSLRVGIVADQLRKEFAEKVAVKNVTLKIYHGQITVLLGHNGAGKTTFASMLTGLYSPTSGKLMVDGIDAIANPEDARKLMGLCPQHDVLYDELTCEEHLRLFATIKGCPEPRVSAEITQILDQLGLSFKRRVLSADLSGGMKRRLSLGMAMINSTKILILDEPTSGLDPEARRGVWDFLLSIRKERLIMLSTHWMEEADVLGDRIAIMSQGRVICCGTSVFLKKAYAGGYHLRIAKSDDFKTDSFQPFIRKFLPNVSLENETANEIRFGIDSDDCRYLPEFFDELDKQKQNLGVFSCGVNVSSMDDVFLKVIDVESNKKQMSPRKSVQLENGIHFNNNNNYNGGDFKKFTDVQSGKVESGRELTMLKLRALLAKRAHDIKRSTRTVVPIMGIAIGCIFAVLGLIETTVNSTNRTPNWRLDMDTQSAGYDPQLFGFYYELGRLPESYGQYYLPEAGREHIQAYDWKVDPTEKLLNDSIKDLNVYRERWLVGASLEKYRNRNVYIAWYNGEAHHSLPISVNVLYNALLKKLVAESNTSRISPDDVGIRLHQHTFEHFNPHSAFLPFFGRVYNSIFIPFSVSFIAAFYVLFPTHERVSKSKLLQLMTGLSIRLYWLSNFIFDYTIYFIYFVTMFMILLIWDRAFQYGLYFSRLSSTVAFVSLFISFGWAAIPFAYLVSSLFRKPSTAFGILCLISVITGIGMGVISTFFETILEEKSSAEVRGLFYSLMWFARLSPVVSLVLGTQKLFSLDSTRLVCAQFQQSLRAILCGIYAASQRSNPELEELKILKPERCCDEVCGNECIFQHPFFWFNWLGVNDEIAMLVMDGILYWLILFAIDTNALGGGGGGDGGQGSGGTGTGSRGGSGGLSGRLMAVLKGVRNLFSGHTKRSFTLKTMKAPNTSDNDVLDERQRVDKIIASHHMADEAIVVQNLTKRYSNGKFLAVDQLSFAVGKEQFFGLLGINGAGKTTTFRMLTGDLRVTNGNAYVAQSDLMNDRAVYQSQIGYCPQFDALLDRLNSFETLYLYGRLRGIPDRDIALEVNKLIKKVDLQNHAQRKCKNYSGGNKRKLSLAMALIGSPPVVLLDEPTSGVDPVARRKMWVAISDIQYNSGSSIILSSHSMDECEALCDRIAIMAAGQFKCVGSTQYLRTKFGQGYSLIIKLKPDLVAQNEDYLDDVQVYVEERLENAQLKDIHQTLIFYHVPPGPETTWSKLFQCMELAKQELNLEDYQVGDTTLEQIFLSFAKSASATTQDRPKRLSLADIAEIV
ncbi:phospholipid-transporting ATPase ABCA3-like [Oppia nitens]|uniref:phospholipid-transporting ATPase ABCA3-like n=1 Tax=Oppia nitens TaxID=1686743 RepID=UPI0023DBCA9B|nr:phospholipid-transporting ATPase ABCA3-like [Oppia nitens]